MFHSKKTAMNEDIIRITVAPPLTRGSIDCLIAQNVSSLLSSKLAVNEEILIITRNAPAVGSLISQRADTTGLTILPWLKFCCNQTSPLVASYISLTLMNSISDDGSFIEISENEFNRLMDMVEDDQDQFGQKFADTFRSEDTSLNFALKLPFQGNFLAYKDVLDLLKHHFQTPRWKYVFFELPPYFGKQELELVAGFGTHTTFLQYNHNPGFDRYSFVENVPNCHEITLKMLLSGKITSAGILWETMP